MTNPALAALTKAQDLIRDPDHWTQRSYARDRTGNDTPVWSDDAHCFCTLGALRRVVGDDRGALYVACRNLIDDATISIIPEMTTVEFNDRFSHEAVMKLWDKARELAHGS